MKVTAQEVTAMCEEWSRLDQKNHHSAVILRDEAAKLVYLHYAGTSRDMAHCVTELMNHDPEFGHDIFVAAQVYAQKNIDQEEIDRVTNLAIMIADIRKNQASDNGQTQEI